MLKEYEINSSTQAIIPIDSKTSMVYEEENEYTVLQSTNKIIEYNCKFYGSSYKGRCEGTKSLVGIKTKLPIIIEESRNIIFFPTSSTRNNQTYWIALNKIKKFYKNKTDKTYIMLDNDKKINLNISLYSLENQYCRAIMLKSKLLERKMGEK